jgi:hypothetical protein
VAPTLNNQTLVQVVPFHTGFHPSISNLTDSPLHAYNDAVSDSDSDLMIQHVSINQQDFYAANYQALTRFKLAKVVCSSYLLPSTALDNAHFLCPI